MTAVEVAEMIPSLSLSLLFLLSICISTTVYASRSCLVMKPLTLLHGYGAGIADRCQYNSATGLPDLEMD